MDAPTERSFARGYDTRLAFGAAWAVGAVMLATRLWSHACQFTAIAWNDMRLAPTIALAQGWSVYPTAEHGVINTWTYGPLPLLYFWPASWAATAGGALLVAAVLNAALALVPLALVCFGWPPADPAADSRLARATAFLVCVALWPEDRFVFYFADNLAIALGLVSSLLLVRAPSASAPARWLAAALATATVACKQTALGIPLAHALWVGLTFGARVGWLHAGRCAITGLIAGGLAITSFGWAGLWWVMVELLAHIPWIRDPWDRLISTGPDLAGQILAPALCMIFARRAFGRPTLLLPALAWACALPLGIMALLKTGGRMNSVHSLMLWLPPLITVVFTTRFAPARHRAILLGGATLAAAWGCLGLTTAARLPLYPQLAAYRDAEALAARYREQIWFPMHPLVTLYSDRRYYHDEDGLFLRQITHRAVAREHVAAHLPRAMRMIALRNFWTDWGVARSLLPAPVRQIPVGDWTIWTPDVSATPR